MENVCPRQLNKKKSHQNNVLEMENVCPGQLIKKFPIKNYMFINAKYSSLLWQEVHETKI